MDQIFTNLIAVISFLPIFLGFAVMFLLVIFGLVEAGYYLIGYALGSTRRTQFGDRWRNRQHIIPKT